MSRLGQKPETVARAKPLYAFFHEFESRYGELAQITKLEKRMSDLFPEDQRLTLFSRRFLQQTFDPTAIRPIISPASQARPKALPTIEAPISQDTPPNRFVPTNSPKRPLPVEEEDNEANRPRKLARGESPLKGAAGRRLDQQKRNRQPYEMPQYESQSLPQAAPLPVLHRDILFILSIIPKAETYHATKFKAEEMVRLIRETTIPSSVPELNAMGIQRAQGIHGMHQMPPRPPMQHMHPMPQKPTGQYNGGYPNFPSSFGRSAFAQPNPLIPWLSHQSFEAQNNRGMGYNPQHVSPRFQDHDPLRSRHPNQNVATTTLLQSRRSLLAPSDDVPARLATLSTELQRNSYDYRR